MNYKRTCLLKKCNLWVAYLELKKKEEEKAYKIKKRKQEASLNGTLN